MEEEEDSLSKQVLNMILENNAIRDTALPFVCGYIVINILIICLLIYVAIRISL